MRQGQIIKHQLDTTGADSLLDGGILIALGLSIFVLNEWHSLTVNTLVGLAWGVFFLLLKGPELVRLIRRTE
jgi:hypothetical protein